MSSWMGVQFLVMIRVLSRLAGEDGRPGGDLKEGFRACFVTTLAPVCWGSVGVVVAGPGPTLPSGVVSYGS